MNYLLIGLGTLNVVLLVLYIKSAINNGRLRHEITDLNNLIDVMREQIEISGRKPLTPEQLQKRMRDGTL